MTDDSIQSKIDLLEDQIENIERSGYFTEKEIDKYSVFYRNELALLKSALAVSHFASTIEKAVDDFRQSTTAFALLKKTNALQKLFEQTQTLTQKN